MAINNLALVFAAKNILIIQKSQPMLKVFYWVASLGKNLATLLKQACHPPIKITPHKCLILATILLIGPTGCSLLLGYGDKHMSHDEFAHYVEKVFRLENQLTSQIMDLPDNVNASLLQAEQHMHQQCSDLNEYAAKESDGLDSNIWLRKRVENSAHRCEQAAQALQDLLNGIPKE
jgi:hypothetical protein